MDGQINPPSITTEGKDREDWTCEEVLHEVRTILGVPDGASIIDFCNVLKAQIEEIDANLKLVVKSMLHDQ